MTIVEVEPVGHMLALRCESCHRVTRDLVWVGYEDDFFVVCGGCCPYPYTCVACAEGDHESHSRITTEEAGDEVLCRCPRCVE